MFRVQKHKFLKTMDSDSETVLIMFKKFSKRNAIDSLSILLSSFHVQRASLFLTFFNLKNIIQCLFYLLKAIFATTCNLVFENLVGEHRL